MRYHKILHPTDYSDESKPALRMATELGHEHGATLVLLHVVDTLGPEMLTHGEVASQLQPEAYRQRLRDEIHRARPADPAVRVEYVLSEEDVVTAILRTATDLSCDLIVMSTHSVTGWRGWFSSSVASEVIHKATCPVLVVKPPMAPQPLRSFEGTDSHPGRVVEKEAEGPA